MEPLDLMIWSAIVTAVGGVLLWILKFVAAIVLEIRAQRQTEAGLPAPAEPHPCQGCVHLHVDVSGVVTCGLPTDRAGTRQPGPDCPSRIQVSVRVP